jgi:hypothetical protein
MVKRVIMAVAAALFLTAAGNVRAGSPVIGADALEHDFGSIDEAVQVEHVFQIKNLGDADLEIKKVEASCGCTTTQLGGSKIPPGGSTPLAAKFNPKGRRGVQTKAITITSNDPKQPTLNLKLSATVTAEVEVQPQRVDFLDLKEDQAAERSFTVTAKEGVKFKVTGLEASGGFFSATQSVVKDGSSYQVTVKTAPPYKSGANRGLITLRTDHPKYPTLAVPVNVQVFTDLVVVPPTIVVQVDEKKAPATVFLSVRSRSKTPFKILAVTPPYQEITSKVENLDASSFKLELANIPTDQKMNGTFLTIQTDAPGGKEVKVPFQALTRLVLPPSKTVPAGQGAPWSTPKPPTR